MKSCKSTNETRMLGNFVRLYLLQQTMIVFFRMIWDTLLGDLSEFEFLTLLIITEFFHSLFFSWMMIWTCDTLILWMQEFGLHLSRGPADQFWHFWENLGTFMNLGLHKKIDVYGSYVYIDNSYFGHVYDHFFGFCWSIHASSICLSNHPSIQKSLLKSSFKN